MDPVPRVIDAAEWAAASAGLAQRARALAAFVADVYGERRAVAAGVVPERVIESAAYHEPDAAGLEVRAAGFFAGLDLVRGDDGELRVLEDNARTPSGIAYATGARRRWTARWATWRRPAACPPAGCSRCWPRRSGAAHPARRTDPFVVMVSDGPPNSAWHEHRELARRMSLPMATPSDLSVRGGRLHAAPGRRPRRAPSTWSTAAPTRTACATRTGAPPGCTTCCCRASAPARSPWPTPWARAWPTTRSCTPTWRRIVRFYLDEEPLLHSVHTYDLGDPGQRSEALERLGELVVKPRDGYGGEGVVLCAHCSSGELREAERAGARATRTPSWPRRWSRCPPTRP